jgi:hypothetical protein
MNTLSNTILNKGRCAQAAHYTYFKPFFDANTKGPAVYAMPTLVGFWKSDAFKLGRQGQILDLNGETTLCVPNPEERERMLGLPTGAIAAPG